MAEIFICYRREDTDGYAGRLFDRLSEAFGKERVFMDVDVIGPGEDFVETIEGKVALCDAFVALIGKQWLTAIDSSSRRRIDDPEDLVRNEIATALDHKIPIIPVLVGGAAMPAAKELPRVLVRLARLNAHEVRHASFRQDAAALIDALKKFVSRSAGQSTAPGGPVDADSPSALYSLGLRYEEGKGVAKDEAEAMRLYRKAADAGYGPAMRALGINYSKGIGVKKDEAEAVRWFRRGAEAGDAGSMYSLALRLEKGQAETDDLDVERSSPLDERFADLPYPLAQPPETSLGFLKLPRRDTWPNIAAAYDPKPLGDVQPIDRFDWSTPSANVGRSKGSGKALREAFEWYRKAAQAGHLPSIYALGLCFEKGDGVDKDEVEGVRWFRKAADAGYAQAMMALGINYGSGIGVQKDEAEAVRWFRKGAQAGHAASMYFLGAMYRDGRGVDKDPSEALRWFRKAAELGDATAQAQMERLNAGET